MRLINNCASSGNGSIACLRNAGLVAVCAVIPFLEGCEPTVEPFRWSALLFDANGDEIPGPSSHLFLRLDRSDARERQRLIADLADVIRNSDSYPGLIAAKALLVYFDNPDTHAFLTQKVVDAIANHCVSLAENGSVVWVEQLQDPGWWHMPIRAVCQVMVDGSVVRLASTALPKGWTGRDPEVLLDGTSVIEEGAGYMGVSPMVVVSLREVLRRDKLLGKHTWHCELTIIAPNGLSCRISRDLTFLVARADDLDRTVPY